MALTIDSFVDEIASMVNKIKGKKTKGLRNDIFFAVSEEIEATVPSIYHAVLLTLIDHEFKPKLVDQIGAAIKHSCLDFTIKRLPATFTEILDVCSDVVNDQAKVAEMIEADAFKPSDSPYHILTECTKKLRKYVQGIENFDFKQYTTICNHEVLGSLKCSDMLEESESESEDESEDESVSESEDESVSESEDESVSESEDESEIEDESEDDYETESDADSDLWMVWEDKRNELETEIRNKNELIEALQEEVKHLRDTLSLNNHYSLVFLTLTAAIISITTRGFRVFE